MPSRTRKRDNVPRIEIPAPTGGDDSVSRRGPRLALLWPAMAPSRKARTCGELVRQVLAGEGNTPLRRSGNRTVELSVTKILAERVGFEPTLPFRVNTLSKRAPSATRPSLRREPREGTGLRFYATARFWNSAATFARFNSMGDIAETATCAAVVAQLNLREENRDGMIYERFSEASEVDATSDAAGNGERPAGEAPAAAALAASPFPADAGSGGTFVLSTT